MKSFKDHVKGQAADIKQLLRQVEQIPMISDGDTGWVVLFDKATTRDSYIAEYNRAFKNSFDALLTSWNDYVGGLLDVRPIDEVNMMLSELRTIRRVTKRDLNKYFSQVHGDRNKLTDAVLQVQQDMGY